LNGGDFSWHDGTTAPKLPSPLLLSSPNVSLSTRRRHKNEMSETGNPNEAEAWLNSLAKAQLYRDLVDGTIPLNSEDMAPSQVYAFRAMFQEYEYPKFRTNLNNLRKKVRTDISIAAVGNAALAHDRQLFPKRTHNHRGEPRWDNSAARAHLKADMDLGLHIGVKPSDLRGTRDSYQLYKPLTFAKHIHQEIRARKFQAYVKAKTRQKQRLQPPV
jgi:hypothetical protein